MSFQKLLQRFFRPSVRRIDANTQASPSNSSPKIVILLGTASAGFAGYLFARKWKANLFPKTSKSLTQNYDKLSSYKHPIGPKAVAICEEMQLVEDHESTNDGVNAAEVGRKRVGFKVYYLQFLFCYEKCWILENIARCLP